MATAIFAAAASAPGVASYHRQTRVTAKYHTPNPKQQRYVKQKARQQRRQAEAAAKGPSDNAAADPKTPEASFELKTYDPVSGVTLKYKTDKAAEVGRLVAAMGRLARCMAGLPAEALQDVKMTEDALQDQGTLPVEPGPVGDKSVAVEGPKIAAGGDTIKKKKKKAKK